MNDHQCDIIVVGGGGAGLAASVAAAEQRCRVLLLEKNPYLGGTTGVSIGSFTACCTPVQLAKGIADDPVAHNEDIGKFNPDLEPKNNWELRQLFTAESGRTLEWLSDMGLHFFGPSPEPPNRVARMHNVIPNAKAYITKLGSRAIQLGVNIRTGMKVEDLLRDNGEGPVLGVRVRDVKTGNTAEYSSSQGVILAAGDFANNPELKRRFADPRIAEIEGINPTATGDGHMLAMKIGARVCNMDVIYGPEIRFIPPTRKPFTQLLPTGSFARWVMAKGMKMVPDRIINHLIKRLLVTWQHPEPALLDHGAVLLNQEGRRFTHELKEPCYDIVKQPGKICYFLFGQAIADRFSQWPYFISTAPDIAYAYVRDYKRFRPDIYAEGATVAHVARRANLPVAALEESVEQCVSAFKGKGSDSFGRTSWGDGLETGPFYLLGPAKAWTVTTEGGVGINKKMQVLDIGGNVIPNLYAAGCTGLGGMVLWGHGLHVGWALTSGRLAGCHAAAPVSLPGG